MAQRVEMKIVEFKEQQASIESILSGQVTKELVENANGSIIKMKVEHDELQDIYNKWYYKKNKIIEEWKEQRQRAVVSGSGTSHK